MSDLNDFPYSHDARMFDEAIAAVASAQIYVLILGRQHGTPHPVKESSIVELEYEAAREAGIPTMVYVPRSLWDGFQADRNGAVGDDVSHWVDSPKVFRFLERIAYAESHRCVTYDSAHEIIDDFRKQTSNLLGGYLRFQRKTLNRIWTERYTREVEEKADLIWILTPDFYWDYNDTEFRNLVTRNVTTRCTQYVYLYKKTAENERRIAEMIREYASILGTSRTDRVLYAGVPEKEFNWCCEQVLYDPGDPIREHAILADPIDGRNKEHKFDIELGRIGRRDLKEQFERLWAAYAPGIPLPTA